MTKIHRYLFAPTLELPTGAVLLDAQPGQTGMSLWFLIDPAAPMETRKFSLVPTGLELPDAIMDCCTNATF